MESKENNKGDEKCIKSKSKKIYSKPQLILHGSLKQITKAGKNPGAADGHNSP